MFDYFNLIVKEYYLAVDKWGQDLDYTAEIKEIYCKIDKELEEEELSEEVPRELTREIAEALLTEKENLLT